MMMPAGLFCSSVSRSLFRASMSALSPVAFFPLAALILASTPSRSASHAATAARALPSSPARLSLFSSCHLRISLVKWPQCRLQPELDYLLRRDADALEMDLGFGRKATQVFFDHLCRVCSGGIEVTELVDGDRAI